MGGRGGELEEATALQLSATLMFDGGTPEGVARRMHRELTGELDGVPAALAAPAARDAGVELLGCAALLPGGVSSPRQQWAMAVVSAILMALASNPESQRIASSSL